MDKLESVASNNLSWLDSEMCDHITRLGDYITEFLCSLPTCENIFSLEEPQFFREWMLLNTEKLLFFWCGKIASKRFIPLSCPVF